jgi:hypothetical protein
MIAPISLGACAFGWFRRPGKRLAASRDRQFSLRQIFAWTTTVAILAFLARYADPPRLSEFGYLVASPLLLALSIACVMLNVERVILPVIMLHLAIVVALLLPDGLAGGDFEELLTFYLVQAIVVAGWFGVWRVLEPRWFGQEGQH